MAVQLDTINLTISKDFVWVLASLVTLSAQLFFANIVYVGRVRSRVFKNLDLEKLFGDEHKKATGQKINKLGYPDGVLLQQQNGSGKYADALPYSDWYAFNVAQRIHYNFIEFFTPFVIITLVAGLHKPCLAASVCFGMVVARIFFHLGYVLGNASNPFRVLGALGSDAGMITNVIVAGCGIATWLGYF